jgi:lipid-A-disaccharide synthase-like uncharacterized protein
MDCILSAVAADGKFLGIEWHPWKVIGWLGNLIFSTRFFIQWYATERHKQVVVPVAFWWASLFGSLCLFSYALFYQKDSVFIFAYAFVWVPYIRNLVIHHRHLKAHQTCLTCGASCTPKSNFCHECGASLVDPASAKK